MDQIKNIKDLKGKTIKKIEFLSCEDVLCIEFEGGSFCTFSVSHEYEDHIIELDNYVEDITLLNFGLISQSEYDLRCERNRKKRMEEYEDKEYKQYIMLKEKYEK